MPGIIQFVQTPVEILMDSTLSSGARDFASQLLRWDWGLGCTLTDKQLAEELDCSVRTIQNHTKALVERGHLRHFEDREGMPIRLVRRPGGIHPRPKGLPLPLPRKNPSRFGAPCKDFVFNNKKLHDTTTHLQSSNSVPTSEPPAPPVVATVPEKTTETHETPSEPASQAHIPDPAIVEVMTSIGVARPGALRLARTYPAIRCWDGVEYVKNRLNQGDPILNPGGYIRRAIEEGWEKPTGVSQAKLSEGASREKTEESPNLGQFQEDPSSPPGLDPEPAKARRDSPYAGSWEKALSVMQDVKNPSVWVNPHAVSLYLRQGYLDRVEEGSAHLVAPACAVRCIQDHTEEIKEALRLAGLEVDCVVVVVKEEVESGGHEDPASSALIAPCVESHYIL